MWIDLRSTLNEKECISKVKSGHAATRLRGARHSSASEEAFVIGRGG